MYTACCWIARGEKRAVRTMGVYAPATGLVRRDGQPSITGNTGVSPPIDDYL